MKSPCHRLSCLVLLLVGFVTPYSLSAQRQDEGETTATDQRTEASVDVDDAAVEEEGTARAEAAALDEDPEAQRRARIEEEPELRLTWPRFEFYASVRLHAIDAFDAFDEESDLSLGDGASRAGVRGEWKIARNWWLFGRAEAGFDVLDTFTAKGGIEDENKGLKSRLLFGGFDSENLTATFGKNWSAYYKIAGMTDRFSIFGGNAAGVYNATTDGGATGTGRADDVLQARIYTSALTRLNIKPFNLNLQYQFGQPIPQVSDRKYEDSYGASAWLETQNDRGLGVAYHRSIIGDPEDPVLREAGIDGDAQALALSFRSYGEKWYAALVVAWLDNIETTDKLKYVNARGIELYAQRQLRDKWWLIAGGNWLKPDENDPQAGEYEILYGVIGIRYTFDSFNRMVYAEWKIDRGTLFDGADAENEFTVGFRWDFGH
jgi:predicted porin